MPVFDPGVPWLRGTATLTNGSTTVETDGVITLNEILEGDRLYVFDNGSRLGPFEIVGGEEAVIELRDEFEGATGSYSIAIDRNPITRTGAKTLRDVADILGRIGNFGELSERDQISSDLIPIGPERDAIKDALDVTKRASNLADLTNLKEARSNLGTFSSVAEVQSRHIPAVLESIRTFGRNSPGDGPPLNLVRGSEVPGAVQSADGQWWEDVGYNTITVRIPSQFPTLQAAIDHYSRLPLRSGATIDLLIESGHRLTHGLRLVDGGSYRKFRISAEDAVVYLSHDFEPVDSSEVAESTNAIFCFLGVKAPILNCLIDGGGATDFDGWISADGADTVANRKCGVNGTRMNLEVRGASISAVESDWSHAQRSCARITAGSSFALGTAKFIGGWKSWTNGVHSFSDCSLHVSRGSHGNAGSVVVKESGAGHVAVRRSRVSLINAEFDTPGRNKPSTGSSVYPLAGAAIALHGATVNGSPITTGTGGVDVEQFNTPTSKGVVYFSDGSIGADNVLERSYESDEGYIIYISGAVFAWKRVVVDCNQDTNDIPFPVSLPSTRTYASFSVTPGSLSGSGFTARRRWVLNTVLASQGTPAQQWRLSTSGDGITDDTVIVMLTAWGAPS